MGLAYVVVESLEGTSPEKQYLYDRNIFKRQKQQSSTSERDLDISPGSVGK